MSYIVPGDVDSPRIRWRLHLVLYDGGEGSWSAAEGQWENNGRWDDVLAVRWNGKGGDNLGNPQSRGRPTWFIVPKELEPAIRAVISNRRDRTSDPPPGDGPEELPTGPGAGALMEETAAASQEAAVTAQEWMALDMRPCQEDGYQPRTITRIHENRQECIADAKRELEISPDDELPSGVWIKHVGADDETLFAEWVARKGHPQRCSCEGEQRYHREKETDQVVLFCQRCNRESLLSVNWRDEAELP